MSGFAPTLQAVVAAAPAANQNDYAPAGYVAGFLPQQTLLVAPTNSIKLTGLLAGASGNRVTIRNTSTDFLLWLEHENASSAAANRFTLPSGLPAFLSPGDAITFAYNATAARWCVVEWPNQGMAMGLTYWDDFVAGGPVSAAGQGQTGIYTAGTVGAGSAIAQSSTGVDTTEKAVGVVSLGAGTSTTGAAEIGGTRANSMNQIVPAQGCGLFVARVQRATAVNGTDTYTLVSGFHDGAGTAPVDGVAWEYRWTGAAEEWSQTRYAASAATRVNTGSPTPDATFVWTVIFMNAAWTRADMIWSQDSKTFTVASSPTTGIPNNTQLVGACVSFLKSVGTTALFCNVDHMGYRCDAGARG